MKIRTKIVSLVTLISLIAGYTVLAEKPNLKNQRAKAIKQMNAGNYRAALSIYKILANDLKNKGANAGSDLESALQCLRNLGRINEVDELRNSAIAVHQKDWRFLKAAGNSFIHGNHYGFVVAGKFHRGTHRGGGKRVNSYKRDRVEALRLMMQAEKLIADEKDKQAASQFYLDFANALMNSQYGNGAWRLQILTNLKELPDYEEGYGYRSYRRGYGYSAQGAPVDKEGNPVYHKVPKSLKKSQSDGERWRWFLTKAMQVAPNRSNQIQLIFAQFLQQQFGVQTMAGHAILRNQGATDHAEEGGKQANANPYALHTLKENETIAKLATGAKRFTLPDEFNFIKIYQNIANSGKTNESKISLDTLASIFENRRQYPKAVTYWKKAIAQYGVGIYGERRQKRLDQIVNNWGRFESTQIKPAGQKARIEFRFRNSNNVHFTAQEIKVEKLLEDVKNYIRTKPARFDWNKLNISNLGHRLVTKNQQKYLGKQAAAWNEKLIPAKNHYDRRKTITTPLTKAGAYLLTAKVKGGNSSRIVIWITDTAIASKNLDGKRLYYVADALTGKPIEKANLEFFGYRTKNIKAIGNRWRHQVNITNFAEFTDANGQVIPDPNDLKRNYNWLVTARTKTGRFAYIGFSSVWYGRHRNYNFDNNKVFTITDRPVYRPEQKVKFKFWIRKARYDLDQTSLFADKNFNVVITDPKGKQLLQKVYRTDGYGGFDGEYKLPDDATLGQYYVQIQWDNKHRVGGGGRFRVEEYKKPEFEVTIDAPKEPVMLGEKITATITAKYYFGAPVTHAKVK
ncbi:alpha-2-macroglobulin domain protein, partial [hydrothermal vent metagenome]